VTVSFDDLLGAVSFFSEGAREDIGGPDSKTHRSAFHSDLFLVFEQTDHRVWRLFVELGAVGAFEPADIAGKLDRRNLHS